MKVLKVIEDYFMTAILVPTAIGVVLCMLILILATLAAALAAAVAANAIIMLR